MLTLSTRWQFKSEFRQFLQSAVPLVIPKQGSIFIIVKFILFAKIFAPHYSDAAVFRVPIYLRDFLAKLKVYSKK